MTVARYLPTACSASRAPGSQLFRSGILWLLIFSACTHAQEESDTATAVSRLRQADSALTAGEYKQAAENARAAAKLAGDAPNLLQRAAEVLYLSGYSAESLPLFDRVVELSPESAPHNWQRGIALCSLGRFEQGAEQFQTHHDVNPDDVENSAWYFLCIAKTKGLEAARKSVIPSRGDGRQPMMSILKMLQGELQPQQVMEAAADSTPAGPARQRAQFYAALYVGLYYDALGQSAEAQEYLRKSQTYGADGYMVDTARVYWNDRFKQATDSTTVPAK